MPCGPRVVDLEPFRLGGSDDRRRVAAALDAACRDSGFLTVTGHGVARSVCTEVLDAFGAFFDLPFEVKRRVVVPDPAANRGYSELGKKALAYSRGRRRRRICSRPSTSAGKDTVGPYYDARRSAGKSRPRGGCP